MIAHRRTLLMLESAITVHSPTTLPMVVVTKPPRIQAGVYQATPGREGRNDGQSWSVFGLVDHPGAPYAFPAWSSQWTCSGVSPHSPLRASSGFAPDSHEAVHTYSFTNSLLSAMLSIAPQGLMRTRIRMHEFNLTRFRPRNLTASSHAT